MVIGYEKEHKNDIPSGATKLWRGSVANFSKSGAELVDPKLMMLRKKQKSHKFQSDMLVVDIMGGQELPKGERKEKLKVPGEVLVLNSAGQLEVHTEIDESREFSLNTFPKPEAGANGGYGDGGYGGGYGEGGYGGGGRGRGRGGNSGY